MCSGETKYRFDCFLVVYGDSLNDLKIVETWLGCFDSYSSEKIEGNLFYSSLTSLLRFLVGANFLALILSQYAAALEI